MSIYVWSSEIKNIVIWPSPKSMQWPCSTGFHIPKFDEFVNLHNIWVNIGAWANDWIWEKELLKIPLAWYRDAWNSAIFSQWWDGIYRCSEADGTWAKRIWYSSWGIVLNYISWRAQWSSIRPFKDTPVVPDSWWTTLYAWTWDAWIFHDSGNGLISLSSDGVNWITIADKNLWATTVWNNWDTLNQNNCWYYYQRWNNYGFPRTWNVTTSWTQVDASNYWPWNYYSSSTFTAWSAYPRDWDSSDNRNLRWWQYTPVKSVYVWSTQVRPAVPPYLCFTANAASSTVQLNKTGSPTAVTLEISTDGSNWSTYTFGDTITLSNIGDKVYFRNTSETDTGFTISQAAYYSFVMTWSIAASWDVTSLINKNLTTQLSNYCFNKLFYNCSTLETAPELPATTLADYCYFNMFNGCSNLISVPELPATNVTPYCYMNMFRGCTNLETLPKLKSTDIKQNSYVQMFYGCTKIKLSATKTWEYQTVYRIPTSWTGTTTTGWNTSMFYQTWWTFTSDPTVNTTYYTSNTLV